jgi:Tfp pilus assembly protein PilE
MRTYRVGVTFVELIAAVAVMAVLFAAAVQMLAVAARQRRACERQRVALELASNLMERATILPYDQISKERLEQLAADLEPKVAGTSWRIDVYETNEEHLLGKRVSLQLIWDPGTVRRSPEIRLVAWRYRPL